MRAGEGRGDGGEREGIAAGGVREGIAAGGLGQGFWVKADFLTDMQPG